MKSIRRFVVASLISVSVSATSLFAISGNTMGDIVKAQILIGKVMKVVDAYQQFTVELEAPQPIEGNTGKYLLPYRADGELTEWASKAVNAQVGKLVGEKVGDVATNAIASKIPFGGLAGGLLKKKTKEVAAVTALGGMKFLQDTSDQSFASLNDYALFLHVRHSSDSTYKEALAAAMAVYPDLEGRFAGVINDAYRTQSKRTK